MRTGLDVEDLTVEYSSGGYAVRPIDGLSLSVQTGELVLLLGASGCGKTTLLSVLASILRPTSGRVQFDGTDVTALEGKELVEYRRHTVGVVFQAFNLVPSLTAWENVAAPLWAAGIPGREAKGRATELLGELDLADRASHRPGDLSGGQAQRVAFARALALDPPLLLADEPTAHLDYIQVETVLGLLRSLATPGRLVVVATHDDRLLPLADRLVSLSPRTAAPSGPPKQQKLAAGEILFRQGDPGDLVWVVESGQVEIVRELVGGGEELVGVYGPGTYFGELAPIYGLRRSATARAAADTPTEVTGYGAREFRSRFPGPGNGPA